MQIERTVATADAASAMVALPIGPFRGDLPWPVSGATASRFGRSAAGRFGTAIVRNGIEVAGNVGVAPAGEAAFYFEVRIDGRPVDPVQWRRRK